MTGKIFSGKRMREWKKMEKRQRKLAQGLGKPSGTQKEKVMAAATQKPRQFVKFALIGKGWFPGITQDQLNMLKKGGRVNVGPNVLCLDYPRTTENRVCFRAESGMDLTTPIKKRKYHGTFFIDLEKMTMTKTWET